MLKLPPQSLDHNPLGCCRKGLQQEDVSHKSTATVKCYHQIQKQKLAEPKPQRSKAVRREV